MQNIVINHVLFVVKRLNVQGRKAALIKSSSPEVNGPTKNFGGSGSHDKPRVIEAEGLMEEYLAFDSRYSLSNVAL